MRAVIQRVSAACVRVDDRVVGQIGHGLLVLLGVAASDTAGEADWMLEKVVNLRIFENDDGKFDRSVADVDGALLVVSQFTLLANTRKGNRPSFSEAARPEVAVPLYERFVAGAAARGFDVATGEFGAQMDVDFVNRGPVTIVLDSATHA
jgi:D-tyrosyl-tRNA(Tyr) deacylase